MKFSYAALLGGVSVIALAPVAHAQSESAADLEEIVVTGSRVVANGNQAPTPVTVVSTERLMETAPSNIPDALNRLPQFAAQPAVRNIQHAGQNATGNYLSLRRFGSQRNLILLDGSRMPPTAASGAVDTNVIPQSLVERVEVVTGGASAVYGSDAVTGVINFIIDKDFTGVKFNSQVGTSNYGDNTSWRAGFAAGKPVFGGRGHIVFSFDHYDSKGIFDMESRPPGGDYPTVGGNGTASNPYRIIDNGRLLTGTRGGMILGAAPPGIADTVFLTNGIPTPFVHGSATGVSGLESGGDGGHYSYTSIAAPLRTNQAFARFDYDLTEDMNVFLQASYNDAWSWYPYTAPRFDATILSGNAFLPASWQQIMTATNTQSIRIGRLNDKRDGLPPRFNNPISKNIFVMTGAQGRFLDNFDWNLNYIYSRSTQRVYNRNNMSTEKLAAAVDAVRDPATGRVVCAISLTQYANRFPDCEPLNMFGPTAVSESAYDFITDDTRYTLANVMHDVNFAVSGSPFSLWAGPVNVAMTAEYRWLSLRNNTTAEPNTPPTCLGIRPAGANCTATSGPYWSDVTAGMYAKQNVKEVGGEVLIPLIRDVPFFRSVELNLAGRYTDYSTSGSVETWKVGGTWQLNDDLRLRGAMSRDIRAPTLQDLFAPGSSRNLAYSDLHTGVARNGRAFTQGNPDLVPEVARTNTIGLIYQPNWLPRFSLAIDYFEITINNAITNASGTSTSIQRECEDSGGVSPFCDLLVRPFPFSNRTPENFPTAAYTQSLNAAREWTRGWDIEANYRFDLADVFAGAPGSLAVRGLVGYQPVLKRQTLSTLAPNESAGNAGNSKLRINLNLNYDVGPLRVAIAERWQSRQFPSDPRINFDLRPIIPAYSYTDVSVSYELDVGGGNQITPFMTIENLFNKKPPIAGNGNSTVGLFYPAVSGFDVIGRYFTVGVRGRF